MKKKELALQEQRGAREEKLGALQHEDALRKNESARVQHQAIMGMTNLNKKNWSGEALEEFYNSFPEGGKVKYVPGKDGSMQFVQPDSGEVAAIFKDADEARQAVAAMTSPDSMIKVVEARVQHALKLKEIEAAGAKEGALLDKRIASDKELTEAKISSDQSISSARNTTELQAIKDKRQAEIDVATETGVTEKNKAYGAYLNAGGKSGSANPLEIVGLDGEPKKLTKEEYKGLNDAVGKLQKDFPGITAEKYHNVREFASRPKIRELYAKAKEREKIAIKGGKEEKASVVLEKVLMDSNLDEFYWEDLGRFIK